MEPTTTGHRPPGDGPVPAAAGRLRGPRLAARLAVAALILWMVIDVLRAAVAVGYYEHRITVVTHGDADVPLAWMAYSLLAELTPPGMATTVADRSWALASLVAATAVVAWAYQARRNAGRLGGTPAWAPGWAVGGWFIPLANLVIPYLVVRDLRRASRPTPPLALVGWWWASVLVAVLLHLLSWLYHAVTSDGGTFKDTALDTRTVAYPLWISATVMIVVAALLSAHLVRRITEAQQQIPETCTAAPGADSTWRAWRDSNSQPFDP